MTAQEREILKQEFKQLSELLKFHVDYDGKLSMDPVEHAAYRDKSLDLMAAIQRRCRKMKNKVYSLSRQQAYEQLPTRSGNRI